MLILTKDYLIPILFLAAILFVTACSGYTSSLQANHQITLEWIKHKQLLTQIPYYQTHGSIAYISSNHKLYAYFNLKKINSEYYRLILTNPIGMKIIDLYLKVNTDQLVENNGKLYIIDNINVTSKPSVGIHIPLNYLQQWMIGLPGNGTKFNLTSGGYLRQVKYVQNGETWTINYDAYHENILPVLPSKIEIHHKNQIIKIKTYIWSLS